MRRGRRLFALLLAAALLAVAAPGPAVAAETVYFTAVNDTLLPDLSDETMPFWSGGVLYVPHTAFDRDAHELGVYYNRSRDRQSAILFKQNNTLIFDLVGGTIEDRNGQIFNGSAVVRGDVVFLPLDLICRYFGLEYSYIRISYGYLVRIKSETVVLPDSRFIDAASTPMAQRYARYERAHAPASDNTETHQNDTPPPAPAQRTAYLVIEATDAARSELLLGYLGSDRAAFLFSAGMLAEADDLLRRLAANGSAIALRIEAAGSAEETLARVDAANRMLWTAANVKTRLVYLDGAGEETMKAVAEAGYCPLRFALDYSPELPAAARASARILSAADANGGSCCVLLGPDEKVASGLSALLAELRGGNCTMARLNEVVA